jgi:mannose-6-phosphate isomerase class I
LRYDPEPAYDLTRGEIASGYAALAARAAAVRGVLAIDGPFALDWDAVAEALAAALSARGVPFALVDVRSRHVARRVDAELARLELDGDPVFARLYAGSLADLVGPIERTARSASLTVVFGSGSALGGADALWYADVPKAMQLQATPKRDERRLFFGYWPAQDLHLRAQAAVVDAFVDLTDATEPRIVAADDLRATLAALVRGPFRTKPAFLPGPWGGQWLRRRLGIRTDAPNLAWSYELIAPEAGLLVRGAAGRTFELSFEVVLALHAPEVLGAAVADRFGGAFPIRFDVLDTFAGGHLSIQCHPSDAYMRDVFGGSYTQDESYYVVETTPGAVVFLGLRDDADVDAFRRLAEAALDGEPFDPAAFLQAQPAEQHRLYLIPAGTPHASGAGNVVLEISATPYLYTLRFYDWLRRDLNGTLRPVHLEHSFANLDGARRGPAVRQALVQEPRVLRRGDGWRELVLGELPELFYAVHRLELDRAIEDETNGTFHVLNLVDGDEVSIETEDGGVHRLSYAETIVVPAATGPYTVRSENDTPCRLVKAFVK